MVLVTFKFGNLNAYTVIGTRALLYQIYQITKVSHYMVFILLN